MSKTRHTEAQSVPRFLQRTIFNVLGSSLRALVLERSNSTRLSGAETVI